MRRPALLRSALLALALLAGSASAGSRGPQPDRLPTPTEGAPSAPGAPGSCTPAAIADILLATPVPVDEIRVVVRDDSPATGAAEVMVESGHSDRVLHVRGGTHGLKFYPALTSSAFRVSLLPMLGSDDSPCVDRIELRRAGTAVAVVSP